ncbi:MAG: UDP-glucose 4-epimerase GalE [Erysipelotrichaceae bacterium]|jgi:UDP-glucose 4-epimerase|nr:UDP-glucose 4-epimerase GalE [Erysipelotrichaceae bacterium]
MRVLVTGGTGYIGSHTVVKLIEKNHEVVIIDNLCNSKIEVLDAIETITGKRPAFYQADIRNEDALAKIMDEHEFDAIIHFAGLKSVPESVTKPLEYYENNVSGSINLYRQAVKHHIRNLVFSSSATVYGNDFPVPFKEEYGQGTYTNPYGGTKIMNEDILKDLAKANPQMSIIALRYFNPVGAHKSALIGENPNGVPNNLMPYIQKVAIGELEYLNITGNDYPTKDGTGVRDYIHIEDLARGHVHALDYTCKTTGYDVINLGTGVGYSVLEVVKAYEKANGVKINCRYAPRRPGDIAECYADTEKAKRLLGFTTEYSLEDMCRDSYNYVKKSQH